MASDSQAAARVTAHFRRIRGKIQPNPELYYRVFAPKMLPLAPGSHQRRQTRYGDLRVRRRRVPGVLGGGQVLL